MPKNITSVEWQALDIPPGLAFDQATGTFTGTPGEAGDFTVPVTVTTNYGTDTKDVMITIEESEKEWKTIRGGSGVYTHKCIDLGGELLFFGNVSQSLYGHGLFFSYNPNTKQFSESLSLLTGEPVTSDHGDDNDRFYNCAIDPVTKKWIAIFGSYIRTPEGVKQFEDDNINFYSVICCGSPVLQKFCAIGRYNDECTSYIFDINGNLIGKNAYDDNGLSPAAMRVDFNRIWSSPNVICWSNSLNKFFVILRTAPDTTPTWIAYSNGGLIWNKYIFQNASGVLPCFITEMNDYLLAACGLSYSGNKGISASSSISKSTDGYNFEAIKTISGYIPSGDIFNGVAYSQDKNTLCMIGEYASTFITTDLINYTIKRLPISNHAIAPDCGVIWSDTIKSFIVIPGSHAAREGQTFYTLHL